MSEYRGGGDDFHPRGNTDGSLPPAGMDGGETPIFNPEEKVSFWKLFVKHKISVLVDCLVFAIFGMSVAFLGPTLFDLGCQTKTDLKQMNWVFFVQLLMTMIGSVSAGYMTGRIVPANVLLVIGMTGLPITMYMIPVCTVLAGLLINLMIMGWLMGCVDCVANLRMILRFGTNVTPFLQALHFSYGLGAFISPMIASPFLLNIDCTPFIDGYAVEPASHTIANETITIAPQPRVVNRAINLSHSKEAFIILGTIQLVIAIIVYCVIFLERKWGLAVPPPSASFGANDHNGDVTASDKDESGFSEYTGSRFFTRCLRCGTKEIMIILALTSASLFIYDGLQSSYADYIYSYAEKNVETLNRKEGAILNSVFWGPFALGRLVAVGLSTTFSAPFMVIFNLSGCTAAMLIALIWQTSRTAIYISTCSFGFFLSSLSPTIMALTEQFININAPITSCMVVFAALGETICPVIVGNLFVSAGPVSFPSFCFAVSILAIIIFIILYFVGRDSTKYRETTGISFIWLSKKVPHVGENMQIVPTTVKYYSNGDGAEDQSEDRMTSRDVSAPNGGTSVGSYETNYQDNYR